MNTKEKNTPKNNTQEELNEYFNKVWEPSPVDEWEYSGLSLLRKIAPHETVIDVGCGDNLFKDKIISLYIKMQINFLRMPLIIHQMLLDLLFITGQIH